MDRKPTGRASSVPKGLLLGAAVSMAVTALMALAIAKCLDLEKLSWEQVGYGIMVLVLSASFLGALTASRAVKRQCLLVSLMAGVVYFGLLLTITALFFGGKYEAVGVTGLLVLAGCGSAGMLGCKRGGKRRKTKVRYR